MPSAKPTSQKIMTVDEFTVWPGDGRGGRYQLVDGEVRAMSPASATHGRIQANLAAILAKHLDVPGGKCGVVTEPAIATRIRARHNLRVPDLGVNCAPAAPGDVALPDPLLLIEIMSPGNAQETWDQDTWDNVWAYTSVPTVSEILIVQSTRIEAELLTRQSDGSWPAEPRLIGSDELLRLASIGLEVPLCSAYAKTYLVA